MLNWPVQQALLTAFSLISFVLVIIPLYWHLEAWNVGCILYILWVALSSLVQFINFNIWRDNVNDSAPVWCDISSRIIYMAAYGIVAASLVINRRLYKIATTSSVSITKADKRRNFIIDLSIGLGVPFLMGAFMWFWQGHRYNIFGGIGPLAAIPNTIMAIVMASVPILSMGLISAFFCVGTLRAFMKRRRQFSELLASNSNLTFNRYFRLMALAGIEFLCTIPLSIFILTNNVRTPIYQWAGLDDLHWGFSSVVTFPASEWAVDELSVSRVTIQFWLTPVCGILFFLFFGLAEEARTHYRLAFTSVAKKLGYSSAGTASTGFTLSLGKGLKTGATIPSFIQRGTKHGSIASFSDKLSTAISLGDLDECEKQGYSPSGSNASSSSVDSPTVAHDEKKQLPLARPDSGVVVVDVDVVTDRIRRSRSLDVPRSVRDSSHIV